MLNVGKVSSVLLKGVKAVKPIANKARVILSSLPADMVTLSTKAKKAAKAPKSLLKAVWKVCRPVLKWTIAAGILAFRAGKGIYKSAGKVLKGLARVIKK